VEDAEAYAEADEVVGGGDVTHFQYFFVDEVGDFFAAGGHGEAAGKAVERGEFLVVLRQEFEPLEARRAG